MTRKLLIQVVTVCLILAGGVAVFPQDDVLRLAISADASSFSPLAPTSSLDESMRWNVNEKLFRFDGTGAAVPNLVKSWEIFDSTLEIHLQENVSFTNGEPFNAEAVAFSIPFVRGDAIGGSMYKTWLGWISNIEVVDEYTVRLVGEKPVPEMFIYLAVASSMYPPKYVSESDDYELQPIGTGPYKLVEWQRDVRMVFERNEDYWGGTPEWKKIIVRPIPDAAARTAALLSGEVDFVENLTPIDIGLVERTSGVKAKATLGWRIIHLMLDTSRPTGGPAPEGGSPGIPAGQANPLTDYRVRQAIWHAIDTESITKYVMEGQGFPANQEMHPNQEGFVEGLERLAYDPDKARSLLAEAGYPDGIEGIRFDFTNDRYVMDADAGLAIAKQLEAVGIRVIPNSESKTTLFPKMMAGGTSFLQIGNGASFMPIFMWRSIAYWKPEAEDWGVANYTRSGNPVMNTITESLLFEMDSTVRALYYKLLGEANRVFVQTIPLWHEAVIRGMSEDIQWDVVGGIEYILFDMIHRVGT